MYTRELPMPAPDSIRQLVAKFEENRAAYRSGKYNEARLRQEFLDKFFIALGWDVYNDKCVAPEYADVIVEDSLDIEGSAKAPDYAFKIGRERKFFVEAKKPAVDIQYGIHPAYQLRRYAWNAHLPLSILTDFEELAVYNCKARPNPTDSAATGRDLFFKYTEYVERWDEIAAIFSRDAVWQGALDRYAETSKGKKGTTEVDDEFLKDMNEWRVALARNIALRNEQVKDEQQLNYAVQMTIDRVIFLRICEDRGIEPEEQLKTIASAPNIYANLLELFKRADVKYNSGLFHFNHEKGSSTAPDTFTPTLRIDDRVLKELINSIYYPCPYIFKEIPVEILGQVYEQFLGQVIRLTPAHQAKVEEKPEVRKAGGVYYTPRYIVDYIVENTVGRLLEGKTPEQAAVLKIVDPACGSGSFLLGAFQYLIDWHERWYLANDPQKWTRGKAPALVEVGALSAGSAHGWKLTSQKKKEILLNNIHGVDIDPQAVEVTKLSLLLKVLEEESGQLSLGIERALPDLGSNIQCGNSLIGEDYFAGQLVVDPAERRRVNPFEWREAFPQVFAQGGFDAVIGNPPYIRIQEMKEWAPGEVEFYKKRYKSASKGNYDIYVVFVEKGLNLLNNNGRLGFILPHKFFNSQYGESLREIISKGKNLSKIVHFSDQQVFLGATTYTCLLFLDLRANEKFTFEKVENLGEWRKGDSTRIGQIDTSRVTDKFWNFSVGVDSELMSKFEQMPVKLQDVATRIFQGLKTGADSVFILEFRGENNLYSNALNREVDIESEFLKPLYKSGNMKRYKLSKNTRYVIFPYKNGQLILWQEIVKNAPKTAKYLLACKELLLRRENGKWGGKDWYCFSRNQALEIISRPKILTADLNPFANYCMDDNGSACFPGGAAGGYGIVVNNDIYLYLLGLLNSKAVDYYHKKISSNFRGGWFGYDAKVIRNIPIRIIDQTNTVDSLIFDQMNFLVKMMLDLHKQTPNTPQEHEQLQRQIAATDRQIDQLVYQLYGLTDEEIALVESS